MNGPASGSRLQCFNGCVEVLEKDKRNSGCARPGLHFGNRLEQGSFARCAADQRDLDIDDDEGD